MNERLISIPKDHVPICMLLECDEHMPKDARERFVGLVRDAISKSPVASMPILFAPKGVTMRVVTKDASCGDEWKE